MGKILGRLFGHKSRDRRKPNHHRRTLLQFNTLEEKLSVWVDRNGYRHPDATVSEAAGAIGVEPYLLQRYFSEERGEDFRSWRSRLRIEDACRELLSDPKRPTSEIGRRVGFSDRSNFARQFSKVTGMTPSQYRERFLVHPNA